MDELRPIHELLDEAEASDDPLVQELGMRLDYAVQIMRKICKVNTKILADTFMFETGENIDDLKSEVARELHDALQEDDEMGIDEKVH